jgi:diguanylate cyclase (GGDEF)-like protein/PAS domain S-box-containing protein
VDVIADKKPTKGPWRSRYVVAGSVAFAGALISVAAFLAVFQWERSIAELRLQDAARGHLQAINSDLASATNVLYTLRAYYTASDHRISRTEYQAFARNLREQNVGLRNTGWARRITREQRREFERAIRAEGNPNFEIWERDAQGNRIRAGDRAEYFPIVYPDPVEYTPQILGYDIASEQVRNDALRRARDTLGPTATPPIDLITKSEPDGIMSFLPVYLKVGTDSETSHAPEGFMYAVFGTGPMVENILKSKTLPAGLDILFFDPNRRMGERQIYWHPSRIRANPVAVPDEASLRAGPHWEGRVRIADQEWGAVFAPSTATMGAWRWQATAALLIGLTMTTMIVAYLLISFNRTLRLEASRTEIIAERERARMAEMAALTDQAKVKEVAERFDTAINNMTEGLCFFDGARRLIVCNRRFIDMYGLPPESIHPGTTLQEIVDLRFEAGSFPAMTKEEYLSWRGSIAVSDEPSDTVVELKDGRVFEIHHRPMPDQGWVATHEDVTSKHKAAKALTEAKAAAERAESTARAAHATLVDALNVVPEGLAVFDSDDRLTLWNQRYAEMYVHTGDILRSGVSFEELVRAGLHLGQYPEAAGREEAWLQERLARHRQAQSTHEQQIQGDRWLRIEERRTADGGSIGVRVDITDLKRSEASFRLLFDQNPLPMWVFDLETYRLLAVNSATCRHYGYSREQLLSMTVDQLRVPESRKELRNDLRASKGLWTGRGTHRHLTADGRVIDVAIEGRPLVYEGRSACVAAAYDMTERKRAEEQISHLARHDALTQLANRTVFLERTTDAVDRARREGSCFTVFVLDLDEFKTVNDSLGHPAGDALLKTIARRLQACVRETDTVARLGGDEFAILRTVETDQQDDAIILANRLLEALTAPYDIEGHTVIIGTSIGIAVAPTDGTDSDRLLKSADLALYRAKSSGRNCYRFFEKVMEVEAQARHQLASELRIALTRNEFELHYQPIIEVRTGQSCGVEALVRWRHPQKGIISPLQFIPTAEDIGLIVPLGEWIIRKACVDAANWPSDVKVAVNLSAIQFNKGNLIDVVADALRTAGLPPDRLELEITESVLLENNAKNVADLHKLKSLGVSIALDDFGTGYSSLSYLTMFPFDKIKIDRSFVRDLGVRADCTSVVCAIVGLGKSLNIVTTAEGVETDAQLALVRAAGCHQAQGYLFGRPVPISEFLLPNAREGRQPKEVAGTV